MLHLKKPAPSKFTIPLAAVKVPFASYTPVVVIESVPSISVGPFATKEPLLIDKVPSIFTVFPLATSASLAPIASVPAVTVKSPSISKAPPAVFVPVPLLIIKL